MIERPVTFKAWNLMLEGLLFDGDAQRAAIIHHPHPLYGGNMNNAVVEAIAQSYQAKGLTSLRYNFRGTGNSGGAYDNGIGERVDVDAAITYLEKRGIKQIDLVGYSFGAWVLAGWAKDHPAHEFLILFIAPPVAFMDFSDIETIRGLHGVIVGSLDDFGPVGQVEALMRKWSATADMAVIPDADHFFGEHMDDLKGAISEMLTLGLK